MDGGHLDATTTVGRSYMYSKQAKDVPYTSATGGKQSYDWIASESATMIKIFDTHEMENVPSKRQETIGKP